MIKDYIHDYEDYLHQRAVDHAITRTLIDRQLLTFAEAAEYLRISRSTLYRFIWSNKLPAHKVGNGWRFYRADVEHMMKRSEGRDEPL